MRGVGFGNLDDPAYPGQMFWYNPQTGQSKIVETGIESNPIRMRSIGIAPDGRVITGGTGTGTGAVALADPDTGEARSRRISELMGVASFRGKIYLGAYPRARIYEYDPSREWRLGVNPKEVWNGNAVLGDRLAIGTVNKSGYLGGQLLFHNPRAGRRRFLTSWSRTRASCLWPIATAFCTRARPSTAGTARRRPGSTPC
ncbi:hypothetical protein [Spongiactinospora sp. 9N601]|uniref:hypothetical protein n=1 Tax=Spongiactinospora sp. 9N601 TaxID=3375149 RepID=UPI00379DE6B1